MNHLKEKLNKLFYCIAYLDFTGDCKKEDTYFYRFSKDINKSNLRTMRSMSVFMLIISIFVIACSFTYFGATFLFDIYVPIAIFEILLLGLIQWLLNKNFSSKACTVLTALHLFHMLAFAGYISVYYCKEETALLFAVVLTISSTIFSLPTLLTMSISTLCTTLVIIASYYVKDSYWFESDTLNGISVLIFSFMFGWRINRIRAEEAFARADAQRLNGELKKISVTDPLTGLYNHRSFQENYYEMFRKASAGRLAFGVIMMDLDKFKAYNDQYGHVAGDDCLRLVAESIAKAVPKEAIVCRYGGEEFIALLNHELCFKAADIGEDIRKAVAALEIPHICPSLETKVVTLSLGTYVGVPAKNEQPMNFVDQADKAMYQSKEMGRNRLTVVFR
ncbi:MAG: GGDEF domain-containing protein [Erysipelotrichaceae bacterium]